MPRKKEQKVNITFDLRKSPGLDNLSIKLLMARSYEKKDIISLFKKLQELGYGSFETGSQGRGNAGKFVYNEKCPESFTMEILKKV